MYAAVDAAFDRTHFCLSRPIAASATQKAEQVRRLFDSVRPNGLTPIGDKLDRLLRQYLSELDEAKLQGREDSVKPVNYIVITDGAASEPSSIKLPLLGYLLTVASSADDPADVIVNVARRLDRGGYLLSQVRLILYLIEGGNVAHIYPQSWESSSYRLAQTVMPPGS